MQRHLIAALAATTLLVPSLVFAETKTLDVGAFHGVDVSTGIRAIVSGGKPQSVIADADREALTDLRYEVRDGILGLRRERRAAKGWIMDVYLLRRT